MTTRQKIETEHLIRSRAKNLRVAFLAREKTRTRGFSPQNSPPPFIPPFETAPTPFPRLRPRRGKTITERK